MVSPRVWNSAESVTTAGGLKPEAKPISAGPTGIGPWRPLGSVTTAFAGAASAHEIERAAISPCVERTLRVDVIRRLLTVVPGVCPDRWGSVGALAVFWLRFS